MLLLELDICTGGFAVCVSYGVKYRADSELIAAAE